MIIYVKLLKMIHKRPKPECSMRIYIVFVITIELFKKVFLLRNLLKGNYYHCLMRAYFKIIFQTAGFNESRIRQLSVLHKEIFHTHTHAHTFKQTLRK